MPEQLAFDSTLSMARQSLYRFAALTFADPRGGAWAALDALRGDATLIEAAALIRGAPDAIPAALGPGERSLADLQPQCVLERLASSRTDHNAKYEHAFGLLVSHACPPYESEFIGGKFSYQRAHAMADVSGFYHAFGLTISDAQPERHDHIALELEFMAFLIGLERRAGEGPTDRGMRRAVCRAAQVRFLKEHLAWWAPAFARLLSRENPGGFYEAAALFLAALIPAERALLNVEPDGQAVAPSSQESPDACEGCHIG